ncbi:MAG: diguanylate cyclase [Lachnospiraceae bacterium]
MNRREKRIVVIGCLAALLVIMCVVVKRYQTGHPEESPLYQAEHAYRTGNQGWEPPKDAVYAKDSGEELFLQGMEAFDAERYMEAKEMFEQALDATAHDFALPSYLYFYINQCDYYLNGSGDPKTVQLALEAISQHPYLANDDNMIFQMVNSISKSEEDRERAVVLLQEYLDGTDGLKQTTKAIVKNSMGWLEYINGEYTKSLLYFYDVEMALENTKSDPALKKELAYAKECLASIHYTFKEYENAIEMYQEVIDLTEEEEYIPYGCYVNMIGAYLEYGEVEKAKEIIDVLKKQLPGEDEETRLEIEACVNEQLANICIMEENYEEAADYLEMAEGYYKDNEGDLFVDGVYFVKFTRCEYMFHTGAVEEAQAVLEDMIESGDVIYYGVENDVYELLAEIYQETGQTEKLVRTYQKLLELENEFDQMLKKEYLEFSQYYQKNNQLMVRNTTLSRTNAIAVLGMIAISVALVIILILLRVISEKNITDQLTGVYNRKKLNRLLRNYRRTGTPERLGVVMIDVDFFKRYNDTYGHMAGDAALKEVAKALKSSVRGKDMVIRYGGEEFLVLVKGTSKQTAEEICKRIQEKLRVRAIPHMASEVSECVTLSIGLCYQTQSRCASLEKMIEYADECLYQSKKAGRNRVTVKEL